MKFVRAEKPTTTDHEKLGKIEVYVETRQFESIEEAEEFLTSKEALLEFVNSAFDTNAKNAARVVLRAVPADWSLEQIKTKVLEAAKNYAPGRTGGGFSKEKSAKAAANDTLRAKLESGENLTREEMLAILSQGL